MNLSLKRLSQVAVILISGYIISRHLAKDVDTFLRYLTTVDVLLLMAGIALLLVNMIVGRYTWHLMMRYLGHDIDFLRSMKLVALFQVGAYIPGGIWHFIGIGYWAETEGIPKTVTTTGTIINAVTNLLTALTMFFVIAPFYLPTSNLLQYALLVLVIPAGFVAIHPRVFYPVINRALSFVGREPIDDVLQYRHLIRIFGVNIVTWTLRGVVFYILISAVQSISITVVPALVGFYAGAWAIGFLIIFLPGGLGVREVTAIYFLTFVLPESLAALFVLAFRVISMMAEFSLVFVFWGLDRLINNT
jgi:uncharacterized membrane protein YbhN (UPF0104 family)